MIQWYPGHMHKAGKEFRKILPQVDIVIEVLDARLPYSSENPMLKSLRGDKPSVKILHKSDLADAGVLADWVARFESDPNIRTLVCNLNNDSINKLVAISRKLFPQRSNRSNMIYALIAGIPNVGKSSIINKLANRNIAKTGNEAALTRLQQRIEISQELTLIDTPGMLWPKIENENSGYRLAASGAIRETALNLQDVASFIAEFLLRDYPQRLRQRYNLDTLPLRDIELLEIIARKRGCIVSGGRVDLEKVSRLLIAEFRSGELGPLCMETPQIMDQELLQVAMLREQEAELKQARVAARKSRRQ